MTENQVAYKTWMCLICGFVYDEAAGLPDEGVAPGTRWEDVPMNWTCPECGARKEDFEMVEVGRGQGPKRMLVTLGYAGWSPGQLEQELSQNAWLTVEAKDAILFDIPAEERLSKAMELLGLDYARLQDEAGHA